MCSLFSFDIKVIGDADLGYVQEENENEAFSISLDMERYAMLSPSKCNPRFLAGIPLVAEETTITSTFPIPEFLYDTLGTLKLYDKTISSVD